MSEPPATDPPSAPRRTIRLTRRPLPPARRTTTFAGCDRSPRSGRAHNAAVAEICTGCSCGEPVRGAPARGRARPRGEIGARRHRAAGRRRRAAGGHVAARRFERRSRFTTWAYKFAIHTAGVAVRRHAWRDAAWRRTPGAALERLADRSQTRPRRRRAASCCTRIGAAMALAHPPPARRPARARGRRRADRRARRSALDQSQRALQDAA